MPLNSPPEHIPGFEYRATAVVDAFGLGGTSRAGGNRITEVLKPRRFRTFDGSFVPSLRRISIALLRVTAGRTGSAGTATCTSRNLAASDSLARFFHS
jgi:hypothetical protein